MPKVKYHNLQGWMRDVRNAMREGDQVAYELAELFIEIDDLVDGEVEVADATVSDRGDDDDDDATDGDSPEVDSGQLELREADAPRARGPAERGAVHSAATGSMGRVVDDMARALGVPAESVERELRRHALGASPARLIGGGKS